MVLRRSKAAYVTHENFIFRDSELFPYCFADLIRKAERPGIDRIVQDLERCPAEHPVPGRLSAGKKICGIAGNNPAVHKLDRILEVFRLMRCVAVRDPHWNAVLCGCSQDHAAKTVLMHMNDRIFRVLFKEPVKLRKIRFAERVEQGKMIDFSAEGMNLLPEIPVIRSVCKEVELHLVPVHMPIIVHQHRLKAAPVHMCYNLKYSKHNLYPFKNVQLIKKS